jgi:uncharacterized protein YebE (UPF0316 family)
MKTNLFWDETDKTIRGSFINMILTFSLLGLIVYGTLFGGKEIVNNLKELQSLIIWFFGLSFGIWSGKKVVESAFGTTVISTKVDGA